MDDELLHVNASENCIIFFSEPCWIYTRFTPYVFYFILNKEIILKPSLREIRYVKATILKLVQLESHFQCPFQKKFVYLPYIMVW